MANGKLTSASSKSAQAAKQVVYVDVDDEITAVIDKINDADARVVALVLPKRATVFQSIVNMKLLKRRAEQAGKHLVLITSEANLMPLAGLAGMHVAATLQSKPQIPAAPNSGEDDALDNEAVATIEPETIADAEAANADKAAASDKLPDDVEELDMAAPANNSKPAPALAAMAAANNSSAAGKAAAAKKDGKLKVPDFLKFRKRLIFAGLGLIALIVLWYIAYFVVPTAQVTIKTKTADINTSSDITLDTAATIVDTSQKTVPAKMEQQQKNQTQQAPATGQQNKGDKATGQVTLTNCGSDSDVTIPAGTAVSANGLNFLTQSSVHLGSGNFDFFHNCKAIGSGTGSVNVTAQKPGAVYNIAPSSFTVAGFGSIQSKSADAFTGGTDNIVKVVQQSDIDAAKAKIASSNEKDTISKQLQSTLTGEGDYPILNTLNVDEGEVTTSTKVGEEAEAVTVSQTLTYTMYGAKKADLRKIIDDAVSDKIDKNKQGIIDDGLGDAKFSLEHTDKTPQLKVTMIASVTAGPKIDMAKVKQDMVGKKSGEVQNIIKAYPGVDGVTVKYSPFWVTKAPKANKTTIVFEKADGSTTTGSDSSGSGSND